MISLTEIQGIFSMGDEIGGSMEDLLSTVVRSLIELFGKNNGIENLSLPQESLNEAIGEMNDCLTKGSSNNADDIASIFDDLLHTAIQPSTLDEQNKAIFSSHRKYIIAAFRTIAEKVVDASQTSRNKEKVKEKEHLLADIYTTIRHYLISAILSHQLWPYDDFINEEALKIVEARVTKIYTRNRQLQDSAQHHGFTEERLTILDEVYQNAARHFDIRVVDLVECLRYKITRNKNTHFSTKVNIYLKSLPPGTRTRPYFPSFLNEESLHPVCTKNDLRIGEKVFPHFCTAIAGDYRKR
jgi:hypothetical protein